MRNLKYFLWLKKQGDSKQEILRAMRKELDHLCADGRPTVHKYSPGRFETTACHENSGDDVEVSYDASYEPGYRGSWNEPSYGSSTEVEAVWVWRKGCWYPMNDHSWLNLEEEAERAVLDQIAADDYDDRRP